MFDYEWELLLLALCVAIAAIFFTHSFATPAIAIPVLPPPAHPTIIGGVQIDFAGNHKAVFYISNVPRSTMRSYTISVSRSEDGNQPMSAWTRTFDDVNEAVDYTERVRDANLYPFIDIREVDEDGDS